MHTSLFLLYRISVHNHYTIFQFSVKENATETQTKKKALPETYRSAAISDRPFFFSHFMHSSYWG